MNLSMKIAVIVLFVAFIGCTGSIMLYQYGPEAWQGTEILYNIHRLCGSIMTFTVIWHCYLNRKWLKTAFLKKGEKK